jgi:hypothetical protein
MANEFKDSPIDEKWTSNRTTTSLPIHITECIKQRLQLLQDEINNLEPYNSKTITDKERARRIELVGRCLREEIALELMSNKPSTLFHLVDCYFNGERF